MRRTKILAATFVASTAAAVPLLASPAQAQVPGLTETTCSLLSGPLCGVLEEVEDLLEPLAPVTEPIVQPIVDDVVTPVLDPVVEAVGPVLDPLRSLPPLPQVPGPSPAPAPAPGPEAPASPAPGAEEATGGEAKAVSSGKAAAYQAPLAATRIDELERNRSVPPVPVGRSLELTPLGLPTLSLGSDFTAPSLDEDLAMPSSSDSPFQPVIEAITAGATGVDDWKSTAALLAIVTLAMATGLLIDQARRPLPDRR